MLQLQQTKAVFLEEEGLNEEVWHMLVCGFGGDGG